MHGATLLLTIDRNFFCQLLIKIVHRWEELLIIRKLSGDTSEASKDIISQSRSDNLGRLVGGKYVCKIPLWSYNFVNFQQITFKIGTFTGAEGVLDEFSLTGPSQTLENIKTRGRVY